MKRITVLLLALCCFNCSTDGAGTNLSMEPGITLVGLSTSVEEVSATSVTLQYSYADLVANNGNLTTEIWFRKQRESEWNVERVAIESGKALKIDGLERAMQYVAKPVFKVGEVAEQGDEVQFITLPFNYTFVREKNPNALWITNIFRDDDYRELGKDLVSYLKKGADSIPLDITIASEDSLLLQATSAHQSFFNTMDRYEERLELSVSVQLKEYYQGNFTTMDLYNQRPTIGQLSFQRIVECPGLDQTKLLFSGLFWDASNRPEMDFNKPDAYDITLSNVDNPSVVLLRYTQADNISYSTEDGTGNLDDFLGNNCAEGFTIVDDPPIRNAFHRGSFLWLSFPTNELSEGDYVLQFSLEKNGIEFHAQPFEFNLTY